MSRFDRLTQWQSGGTSLRKLQRARKPGEWDGATGLLSETDASESTAATDAALGAPHARPDAIALGTDLEAEVGERLLWGDDDADDSAIPIEALPVYRVASLWRDSAGEMRATIHGHASEAAYARGECVLGQGSLWQESAALSLQSLPPGMPVDAGVERNRRSAYDVRPHLLLLLQAQDFRALEPCVRYGRNYLAAWCERNRIPASPAAINAASADGLASVYRLREPHMGACHAKGIRRSARLVTPSIGTRSRELGMRNEDFAQLRTVIADTYMRRFTEGMHRFGDCANYSAPKAGSSESCALMPETWWHPERLPTTHR